MKLLLEISAEVSKSQFLSVIGSLVIELHNIASSLEKMTDDGHGDILTRHFRSRTARWFSQNFPTILNAASGLRSVNPVFAKIAKIGVSTFTASSNQTELTKSAGYKSLMGDIYQALRSIGAQEAANKLQAAEAKCERLISDGRAEYQAGVASVKTATSKTPKNDIKGKQNAAVEQVVNDAINNLPKHLQHAARQAISKADNKLIALQTFMKQNGA